MNLSAEFVKDAMRTNNPMVGQYGNMQSNMVIHALLGVASETWELVTANDGVNMIEELGDIRWFFALFQHTTGVQLDFDKGKLDIGATDEWTYKLIDIAKRLFAYGESVDKHLQEITYTMQSLGRTLSTLTQGHSKILEVETQAQSAVINKLRARFPEKFTEDHAIDRDTDYEREILEHTVNGARR